MSESPSNGLFLVVRISPQTTDFEWSYGESQSSVSEKKTYVV